MNENLHILLEDVSVAHENNIVLRNVNLRIMQGEFVYLIGRVGSGKSSLLKMLYAEIPILGGNAAVLDYDIDNIQGSKVPFLRRQIGMVFQDFQLLSDRNVEENLKFVLKATGWKNETEMNNRIGELLISVGMLDKLKKMPHELSGGEQQRVAIARATLNNPPMIFADEPTGNLDPESADNIMNILLDLNRSGKTIVMVTHNYAVLKKYPARTVLCENGEIRELPNDEAIDMSDL
ncbi:MAG TPA: ATP-binding cassette domain-containing protein [Bacteroidales bacterium]|nr:ATP-binding cassette domain-containing protein [Bacteroidales bacterium]